MSSFITRLDEYMRFSGLNDNQVTNRAHLAVGAISKARKRDSALSADNIEKLLYEFTDINARWLITGVGEMLNEAPQETVEPDVVAKFFLEENKNLHNRVEELLVENTKLVEQIKYLTQNLQMVEDNYKTI